MELQGNVVLITGGSSGIGLAMARRFRQLDNDVIVTGRRIEPLEEARRLIPGLHTLQSDVSQVADVQALAKAVRKDHGTLDILINNAGVLVSRNCAVPTVDLDELTREVDVNLSGTIRVTAALIDLLRESRGVVVNIGSCLAYVPLPSAPIYSATKAAIHSYSTSLRFQLADKGVRVVEVMPPGVRTAMTAGAENQSGLMEAEDLVEATIRGLRTGRDEIRPRTTNQLRWLSRIAPSLINRKLFRSSKDSIPAE